MAVHLALAAGTLAADLPSPPLFERWVLERPEPLAATAALMGMAALLALLRRGQVARGAICMGAGLVTAGVILGTGWAYQTDREAISQQSSRLVYAVTRSDDSTVADLLDDRLVIASGGSIVYDRDAKERALGVVCGYEWFEIDEWSMRLEGAALDGPHTGRTRAIVRAGSSRYNFGVVPMTWEFTWGRMPDGAWRVTRVELLTVWGQIPPPGWPGFAEMAAAWARAGKSNQFNAAPDFLRKSPR